MLGTKSHGLVIGVEQLRIGLYVSLEAYWLDHPFLFNRFRLSSEDQIDTIRALGVDTVVYFPEKSVTSPLPLPVEAPSLVPEPPQVSAAQRQLALDKQERIERLARQKDRIARCDKEYTRFAGSLRGAMQNLFSDSEQACRQLNELVTQAASYFAEDQDVILHLLNQRRSDDAGHFHALNVMVLSLLLGKAAALDDEAMHELGVGSLLHDLGKDKVPMAIVRNGGKRASYEEDFFRLHTRYGEEMAIEVGFAAKGILDVVRHHHEALDGSGYPDGLAGSAIPTLTRIVAIANRYEALCNPVNVEQALPPAEALSQMFKHELAKHDPSLLQLFIKMLGVYPPGSLVRLSNGVIGLVIGVNGDDMLKPSVLVYDPSLPKREAPIVELSGDPNLKVEQVLRPQELQPEVLDYLTPRRRFNYYDSAEPRADTKPV